MDNSYLGTCKIVCLSRAVLVVLLCAGLLVCESYPSHTEVCPRRQLITTLPAGLGVTHVSLMGEIGNVQSGKVETVIFHAFVKVVRSLDQLHLFGIGWIEGLTVGREKEGVVYMPADQAPYQTVFTLLLQPVTLARLPVGPAIPVSVYRGSTDDTRKMGFRLQATFDSSEALFLLQPKGWQRSFALHAGDNVSTGLIMPFKRPPRLPDSPPSLQPDLQQPQLVVVLTLHSPPGPTPAHAIYYAQQFLRHTQYHLQELSMQRVLVYIHEALFHTPAFRHYVEVHLPADIVPFVTFVVWNEFFIWHEPLWDQYLKYYHAVVALWGQGDVVAALIDVDEYIAFSGPHTSLLEALLHCNASTTDWATLANMFLVCDGCLDAYLAGNGFHDMHLWAGMQQSNFSDESCHWYQQDPLLNYTKRWSSKHYQLLHSELGTDESKYPVDVFCEVQGKALVRVDSAVAFIHHRGELLPGRTKKCMDPRTCPYVAHLVHSNGFRPKRFSAGAENFSPSKQASWWLLN